MNRSYSEIQAEQETAIFISQVERVRELLIRKQAEDLIEMLIGGLENGTLYASLPASLNGRK